MCGLSLKAACSMFHSYTAHSCCPVPWSWVPLNPVKNLYATFKLQHKAIHSAERRALLRRYVARKDAATNTVYVSRAYYAPGKCRNAFLAGSLNWLAPGPPSFHVPLSCKVRHGPRLYACAVELGDGGVLRVSLQGDDQGLAAGQVAVFYRAGLCLGSAVILEALDTDSRVALPVDEAECCKAT